MNHQRHPAKLEAKPERKPVMLFGEYCEALDSHTWLFSQEYKNLSYFTVFAIQRQEQELFKIAVAGGPDYIKEFTIRQMATLASLLRNERHNATVKAEQQYAERIETGDPDFDKFRELVNQFDWYWRYSDSGSVRRAAAQREEHLMSIVADKGGLYQTYFYRAAKRNGWDVPIDTVNQPDGEVVKS